jgi:hypothetical protein
VEDAGKLSAMFVSVYPRLGGRRRIQRTFRLRDEDEEDSETSDIPGFLIPSHENCRSDSNIAVWTAIQKVLILTWGLMCKYLLTFSFRRQ